MLNQFKLLTKDKDGKDLIIIKILKYSSNTLDAEIGNRQESLHILIEITLCRNAMQCVSITSIVMFSCMEEQLKSLETANFINQAANGTEIQDRLSINHPTSIHKEKTIDLTFAL